MEDDLVQKVFTYLSKKQYPDGSLEGEKRVIRKKALKFMISEGGELLYKYKKKDKLISCDVCQRMNRKLNCGKPEMHPIKVEVIATKDKMAVTAAGCLFKVFMRLGVPRVLLSDNRTKSFAVR
ncbi:uncharacterized protein LOC124811075 isoform X2 [Hydra vulgaris]|uniref:uncharacterized protein LOC124811075 isoform X2 n=1 Tax=Hydra vulgaris TaxID=6087 RepID=UPI001F5FD88E|nr:uncharacterized protein LOC124811075 isoform X2 [Hydra vulgaris]